MAQSGDYAGLWSSFMQQNNNQYDQASIDNGLSWITNVAGPEAADGMRNYLASIALKEPTTQPPRPAYTFGGLGASQQGDSTHPGLLSTTTSASQAGKDPITTYVQGPNPDPAEVWKQFQTKFSVTDPAQIKSGMAWIGQVGGPEKQAAMMGYLKSISKAGDPNSPYNLANKDDLSKYAYDNPHYQAGLTFAQSTLNKLGITNTQIKDATSLANAYQQRVSQAGGQLSPAELKHWKSAAYLFGIDDAKLPPELKSSAFGMGTGAPDDPYTLAGQAFAASYGYPQIKDQGSLIKEYDARPKPLSAEEAQLWKEAAMMFGIDTSGFDLVNGNKATTPTGTGATANQNQIGFKLPPGITPSNLSVSKFADPNSVKPYDNNYSAASMGQVMNNMQGPSESQFDLFRTYVAKGDYANAAKLARGFGYTDKDISDYVGTYAGGDMGRNAAQYLYENPADKYANIAKTNFDRIDTNGIPQVVSQGIDINGIPKVIYSDGTAVTGTVNDDSVVQNRMTGLLGENSKYLQLARNNAMMQANSRGLLNSSIAAGAGENAAIQNALPIAQQDAKTYADMNINNVNQQNEMARLNANNQLDASKSNSTNWLSAATTNANNSLDASKANAGNWLSASTTNANNSLTAGTNDANAVNTINRDRLQNQLAAGLQTQSKNQDLYNSLQVQSQDYQNKSTLQDKAHLNDVEMVAKNQEAQGGLLGYQAYLNDQTANADLTRTLVRDQKLQEFGLENMYTQSGLKMSEADKDQIYKLAILDKQLAADQAKILIQGQIEDARIQKQLENAIEIAKLDNKGKVDAASAGKSGGSVDNTSVQWAIASMNDKSNWDRYFMQRGDDLNAQDQKRLDAANEFLDRINSTTDEKVSSALTNFGMQPTPPARYIQTDTTNSILYNGANTANASAASYYKTFGLPDMKPPKPFQKPIVEQIGKGDDAEKTVRPLTYITGSSLGIPGTEYDRYKYPAFADMSPEEQVQMASQYLNYNPSDIQTIIATNKTPKTNTSNTAGALA
jgi:hypothetical protein